MSLILTFGALVNAVAGSVLVAFGAFVATRTPRTRLSLLFATFCSAFGLVGIFYYVTTRGDPLFYVAGAMSFVAAAAVAAIALTFPRPLVGRERRRVIVPALIAFAWILLANVWTGPLVADWPTTLAAWGVPADAPGPFYLWHAGFITNVAAHLFAVLLFTVRAWGAPDESSVRRLATLAGTIALYPGIAYGVLYFAGAAGGRDPTTFLVIAILVPAAALWLAKSARGPAPRASRNAALVILAAPATGLAVTALLGVQGAFQVGLFAFLRTVVVLVLGHAMLRHQLLDLDLRVRWTISKSTIAATFIAVFFIASEGAQQFFAETSSSAYVGIAAAGVLVFAIAPLSRLSDRLAAKAIPLGPAPHHASVHEEAYRASVRLALRGGITRTEERDLARIAEAHGLSPMRALELREEAERERASG